MVGKIGKYRLEKTDDGTLVVAGKSSIIKTVSIPKGEYLEVKGSWYVDQLPTKIVIELKDGSLEMFNLSPFKKITFRDLLQYKGLHPRKLKGDPLPEMLYQYYGLTHYKETMSEVIKIRLKPSERDKLSTVAEAADLSVSEFIRDYIKTLSCS